MPNDQEKNLATTGQGALAAFSGQKRGLEEPTAQSDLEIPRAKLLQALSPDVVENGKDFQSGMIINSLTKEVLPAEFIPIFKFTTWARFNPRDKKSPDFNPELEPGAMIWRSTDPEDERVKKEAYAGPNGQIFGPNGEIPKAITFMNFFSYFPGVPMPVVLSFSRTSYKAGRHLVSLVRFTEGDMFSRRYRLGVKQQKNDMGTFYVLTVDPVAKATEDEYKLAESLWEEFRGKEIKVHEENPDDAGSDGGGAGSSGRPF